MIEAILANGLIFLLILLVTALLAGLIVYCWMRCKMRRQLQELQDELGACGNARGRLQQDLDACIAARDAAATSAVAPMAAPLPEGLSEKQQAELERIQARSAELDFATIGTANAADKDDLKIIKGIGPFIETKLNALGIYTFEQVANFTPEIEEQVNEAIEFFPGRVKRDNWTGQARELANG